MRLHNNVSGIAVMNALNFLKLQPLTNWLDYFLDRSKFFDLIANANKNKDAIGQLLDQFIEQAMGAEREQAQLEAKDMDEDDVLYMRYKVDELWMCAICALAALSWDINALQKCSNVQRIRALWNKLCRWVFSDAVSHGKQMDDMFSVILASNEISAFNSEQIFTLWLYARWVLLVDVTARFPQPPPKPTVSNPQNQVDQALLQAEKLRQVTGEIRLNVPAAVKLLDQFLGVSNGNALKAYGHECFHVQIEAITATSICALKNESRPSFGVSCVGMSRLGFQNKTRFSLVVAHFAARHFHKAKTHLEMISANLEKLKPEKTPFLQSLLQVDTAQLRAYSSALNFQAGIAFQTREFKPTTTPEEAHAHCMIDAAVERRAPSPKMLLKILMNGSCISKHYLNLLNDSKFLDTFFEEVSKQFWSLRFVPDSKDRDNTKRLHVYCALYFFCLISPGFADKILNHPHLKSLRKWRGLATTAEMTLSKPPRNDEISCFLSNETPFWNVMVSFDLEVIKNGLTRLQNNFRLPYRHRFSDVIGETVLNRSGRIYNQVVLHLWKLEQLASINNIAKWKVFINGFVTNVMQHISTPEVQELLAFDLVRADTDLLNRQLFKVENINEYKIRNAEHFKLVSCSMQMVLPKNSLVFTRFAHSLAVYLLNNRHYQVIALTDHHCFKSTFTDLARYSAVYFLHMFETRDPTQAKKTQLNFWTSIWPTFELSSANRRHTQLIPQKKFMEFIANLKEANVLDFFFSFLAHIINTTISVVDVDKSASPLHLAVHANRRINAPSESIWHHMSIDPKSVDFDFTKRVLEVFCRNSMIVSAINVHWLRICGDYHFLCEDYQRAITYYLEIVITRENKVGVNELSDVEMDQILAKVSVACAALRMPTLAVIVGQLRHNMTAHYPQVEWMLQNTSNTVDAGYAYFPLIADVTLVEYMAAAYNKFGLTLYTQKLLKTMPTKAINANNPPKVLKCEVARRRSRFLDVLLNQFF